MYFSMKFKRVTTSTVDLHVAFAGPKKGPLVILLHGFPEGWRAWKKQIEALGEEGYRVLAPDQRGYGLSDRPQAVRAYTLEKLGQDILELIDSTGRDQVHLVGHDWGAAVAWWIAQFHPERLKSLTVLNVPHPSVMMRHLRRDPLQMVRSWYMAFFQLRRVPEFLLSRNGFNRLKKSLAATSAKGTFSESELKAYEKAWSRPGALTGMLNWYRALRFSADSQSSGKLSRKVSVPTLILWGTKDHALRSVMAAESLRECEDARLIEFDQATHWIQHEEPTRVTELLQGFFRERHQLHS